MIKHLLTLKIILISCLIFIGFHASGWGTDKVISTTGPSAQHSIAAKQNGVLFAAMPGFGIVGPNTVTFFTSTDNGNTWSIVPLGGIPSVFPVVKTKMVTTAMDSIYCLFLQNNIVYFVNVESGTIGFHIFSAADFDAVPSTNGNWIYLWIQGTVNNEIRRYGTVDGGLTWTGNTALTTSNGVQPKVCIFGTRIILNYFGPVLPDPTTSAIRTTYYNETSPGTLNFGPFIDVAPANGIKRKQFKSVIINTTVWFLYTEGDTQQVLKCRNSLDNGVTYQPAFTVAGSASVITSWFDAAGYSAPMGSGVTLTYLADSLTPVTSTFDKMIYTTASVITPAIFTTYPSPYDTYNDTLVTSVAVNVLPVVMHYNSAGGTAETGIAWVGESSQGPWLYFDRLNALVGMNEVSNNIHAIVYPSPATDNLTIEFSEITNENLRLEFINTEGKSVFTRNIQTAGAGIDKKFTFDVSQLAKGIYFMKLTSGNRNPGVHKIIIQ